MVCSFFGRRNIYNKELVQSMLKCEIEKAIKLGVNEFFNGLCGDFDILALNATFELKKKYPHIKSYVVKAYMKQTTAEEQFKGFYDCTIYPDLEFTPPKFCLAQRIKWMAQKCDMAITYVDANWGGSYNGYKLAKKLRKPTINLAKLEE